MEAAKKFAHDYFLSRDVDLRVLIKIANPKKALALTVEKFGRERPVSRYESFQKGDRLILMGRLDC
jgi:large subunit ribosomal protein L44